MAPHAGFAAALGIDEAVLQDLLQSAYLVGQLPHRLQTSAGVPGLLEFSADFFSDTPRITLSAAHPGTLLINISAWGPMAITLPGSGAEERGVRFEAQLEAPLEVAIEDAAVVVGIRAEEAALLDKSFTVFSGGSFSQGATSLLDSQLFHVLLEQSIRDSLALNQGFPSIGLGLLSSVLGPVLTNPDAELIATPRVFDGALVIGVDFFIGATGTAGNPAQLSNIVQGFGMAVSVNPEVWLPRTRDQMLEGTDEVEGLSERVASTGATLDAFELELRAGALHVSGEAHKGDLGSVEFSFDLVPHLVRPAQTIDLGEDELGWPCTRYVPEREELWLEVANITVNVHRAWWVVLLDVLLGTLTAGIVALVVEALVAMVRGNIERGIAASASGSAQNREYRFVPVPNGPIVTAKIDAFQFRDTDVFMGLSVSTAFAPPAIYRDGASVGQGTIVSADDIMRGIPLIFSVRLPHTAAEDDPFLRIRWMVRKVDDNTILVQTDAPAAVNRSVTVDDVANATAVRVSCRVFRVLGSEATDLFSATILVSIRDRLDRRHPYVRWYHYVWTPNVQVEPDGSRTILGGHIKYRESQIHRTDIPGRCQMASRYSLAVPARYRPPPSRPPRLDYMDALPFPSDRIRDYRHLLCEYCFFGGPANTVPLPLPGTGNPGG